jgi:hypothetical protein
MFLSDGYYRGLTSRPAGVPQDTQGALDAVMRR